MPYLYEIVSRIPRVTGITADAVEVVHHWLDSTNSAPDSGNMADMIAATEDFWNGANYNYPISGYMATCLSRAGNSQFVIYGTTDLDGSTPFGPPLDVANWSLGAPSGAGDLPAEVCATLSFHGDLTGVVETQTNPSPPPATIRPAARRRGRSYIGPLMGGVASEIDGTTNEVKVGIDLQDDLAGAASRLRAAGVIDFNWVVWSKTDAAAYEIVGGFIDNAFDTQRRRGNEADFRTTWS